MNLIGHDLEAHTSLQNSTVATHLSKGNLAQQGHFQELVTGHTEQSTQHRARTTQWLSECPKLTQTES